MKSARKALDEDDVEKTVALTRGVMPWVAACRDLLAAPLLGYCLAVRKLALQAGILQESESAAANSTNGIVTNVMALNATNSIRGKDTIRSFFLRAFPLFPR